MNVMDNTFGFLWQENLVWNKKYNIYRVLHWLLNLISTTQTLLSYQSFIELIENCKIFTGSVIHCRWVTHVLPYRLLWLLWYIIVYRFISLIKYILILYLFIMLRTISRNRSSSKDWNINLVGMSKIPLP